MLRVGAEAAPPLGLRGARTMSFSVRPPHRHECLCHVPIRGTATPRRAGRTRDTGIPAGAPTRTDDRPKASAAGQSSRINKQRPAPSIAPDAARPASRRYSNMGGDSETKLSKFLERLFDIRLGGAFVRKPETFYPGEGLSGLGRV